MNCKDPCNEILLDVSMGKYEVSIPEQYRLRYQMTNISGKTLIGDLTVFSSKAESLVINEVVLAPGGKIVRYQNMLLDNLESPEINIVFFVSLNGERVSKVGNLLLKQENNDVNNRLIFDIEDLNQSEVHANDIIIITNKNTKKKIPHIATPEDLASKNISILLPAGFDDGNLDVDQFMFEIIPYQATEMSNKNKPKYVLDPNWRYHLYYGGKYMNGN